jgi:phosphate butyryltransferase
MRITDLTKLVELARDNARKTGVRRRAALVAAHEAHVLEAVILARQEGIIDATLIGEAAAIEGYLIGAGEVPDNFNIIDAASHEECVRTAIELVQAGKVDFLIKGILETGELMKGLVNKETGIVKEGAIVCPVALLQSPLYHKVFALADVGINLYPDVDKKVKILENCVWMMHHIGVDEPKVALLGAVEKVNPKMPDTLDSDAIKQKWLSGEIDGCIVEGPISFDLAMDKDAAAIKHYTSPVAGNADILIVPNMVAGNLLIKGMGFFGQMYNADLVIGLEVPLVFGSRGGPVEGKLRSIALAALVTAVTAKTA